MYHDPCTRHWDIEFTSGKCYKSTAAGCPANGAHPKDLPKQPHDVLATIYRRHLDIDVAEQAFDYQGRPHMVLPQGKPIDELF